MILRSAISNSVLWFFQRTAVRIGAAPMKSWLQKFSYGNADTSGDAHVVLGQWQVADLAGRAGGVSQAVLLRRPPQVRCDTANSVTSGADSTAWHRPKRYRLAQGGGAVAKDVQLVAKTGVTTADGTRVSWLVGALDANGQRHIFASAVWRAGEVDPLDATKQAIATFVERGLLMP